MFFKFQLYIIIIWYLYILQNDHHKRSSYHPLPYSWALHPFCPLSNLLSFCWPPVCSLWVWIYFIYFSVSISVLFYLILSEMICIVANGKFHLFLWLSSSPLCVHMYVCNHFYPLIYQWMLNFVSMSWLL